MPLPKPSKSKMVSRRIKKSNFLLFAAGTQAEELPIKPQRKRRVRVICTDPDATDSSSDEEGERAPIRPRYTHKRFVCEISLPASPPTSFNENQQEETSMGSASSSSACCDLEKTKGFKTARKELGLQTLYDRSDEPNASPSAESLGECLSADNPSAGVPADNPSAGLSVENPSVGLSAEKLRVDPSADKLRVNPSADKLSAGSAGPTENNPSGCLLADNRSAGLLVDNLSGCPAKEFEQFLNEFFSAQDDSSIPSWDRDMDLLDDSIFDNPFDFELDIESATWINSVQTV